MRRMIFQLLNIFMIVFALLSTAHADSVDIGFEQHVGADIPADIFLTDDDGKRLRFDKLLHRRPAILLFNYYRCANVCGVMINKTLGALHAANLQPGTDVDVLIVSIDPTETFDLAAAKKISYMQRFGKHFTNDVHFLTGSSSELHKLQRSAGFAARYDAAQKQYVHPTGLIFLTAQARISSYEPGLPSASDIKKHTDIAARGATQILDRMIASICEHLTTLQNSRSAFILHSLRSSVAALLGMGLIAVAVSKHRRFEKK